MEGLDEPVDVDFDYMFKFVVVGNSGVGKTAYLRRYCKNTFIRSHVATVGIDFYVKSVHR